MKKMALGLLFILASTANALPTATVDQYSTSHNLINNPGFENGLYGWSATSGTLTQTNVLGSVAFGNASAYLTPSSPSSSLRSSAFVLSSGLYGGSCLARMMYRGGQDGYAFSVLNGDNSVIAGSSVLTKTNYGRQDVTFTCPTSGSLKLQVIATSGAYPSILVDDFYLGENFTAQSSTGSQYVVGVARMTAAGSCNWSTTSATANTQFGTASSCVAPTSEYLVSNLGITFSTTDSNLPQFTYNNLPSGKYLVRMHFIDESGGGTAALYLTDGTDYFAHQAQAVGIGTPSGRTIEGIFSYSTSGNRTFEVRGSNNGASTTTVRNDYGIAGTAGIRIVVVRVGD